MTREELTRALAEVIAGLQVPVSLGMNLGAAREPWGKLFDELHGFGWTTADELEAALNDKLAGQTIDFVFDGPPGPNTDGHHCNFVETEALNGHSVGVGEWIDRGDGLWALRVNGVAGVRTGASQ